MNEVCGVSGFAKVDEANEVFDFFRLLRLMK